MAGGTVSIDFHNMTWTCHVCGDERPDDKISVAKHPLGIATVNVRYCKDRPECAAKALAGDVALVQRMREITKDIP